MQRLLPFVCLLAAMAACTPEPDPLDPPPAGYVGEFVLARVDTHNAGNVDTFIFAEASFHVSDEQDALTLDAGSTAGLRDPVSDATLPLIRRDFLGDLFYQRDPDTDPFGAELYVDEALYDVWVSGTKVDGGVPAFNETARVQAPSGFTIDAPDFDTMIQVTTSSSLTVDYTASGNTTDRVLAVLVVSDGSQGVSLGIESSDDGSITIPASAFQTTGAGSGTLTIYRIYDGEFALPAEGTATTRGMFGHTAFIEVTP